MIIAAPETVPLVVGVYVIFKTRKGHFQIIVSIVILLFWKAVL